MKIFALLAALLIAASSFANDSIQSVDICPAGNPSDVPSYFNMQTGCLRRDSLQVIGNTEEGIVTFDVDPTPVTPDTPFSRFPGDPDTTGSMCGVSATIRFDDEMWSVAEIVERFPTSPPAFDADLGRTRIFVDSQNSQLDCLTGTCDGRIRLRIFDELPDDGIQIVVNGMGPGTNNGAEARFSLGVALQLNKLTKIIMTDATQDLWLPNGCVAIGTTPSNQEMLIAVGNTPDTDGDTFPDFLDNCRYVANAAGNTTPSPFAHSCDNLDDADPDGYGNVCDQDPNNDGAAGLDDLAMTFLLAKAVSTDPHYDYDCDGAVGLTDVAAVFLASQTAQPPGPSGLACAGTIPCEIGP